VLTTLKARNGQTVRSVIRWVEDKQVSDHERGQEYLVFLYWEAPHSRYDAAGGLYAFSIQDGRVDPPYDYFPEIEGKTLEDLLSAIGRALGNGR
jgi:hypothetical protein